IDQCTAATRQWKNSYLEPCHLPDEISDQNIIFCTMDRSLIITTAASNNNQHDECDATHCDQQDQNFEDDDVLDVKEAITQHSILAKMSHGFKMKHCYYDQRLKRIHFALDFK